MNILYLTPRYYPHVGGIEYVVKSVAERLAKQGHNVTVLCGETGINVPREEWVNGVHVVRWPVWSPGDAYHIPKMRNRLARWLLGIGNKCDVIHLHSVHGILPMYSLRVLRSSSVRKVLTPHYHGTGHTLFRSILWILWRRLVSRLIKSVDVIHCVSNHEANLVRRSLKIGCTVIEHGVDEQIKSLEWKPEDYALYAGRIEWYKNIERLARIIKILNINHGLNLELKIIGDGPHKRKLIKHLEKLRVDYELSPFKPYEEYIKILSRALFIANLSTKEAYALTINEANAIGVPAVIVEPWGLNFSEKSRTLITQLYKSNEDIAQEIIAFLSKIRKQPKPEVPGWNQIVDIYVKNLYNL